MKTFPSRKHIKTWSGAGSSPYRITMTTCWAHIIWRQILWMLCNKCLKLILPAYQDFKQGLIRLHGRETIHFNTLRFILSIVSNWKYGEVKLQLSGNSSWGNQNYIKHTRAMLKSLNLRILAGDLSPTQRLTITKKGYWRFKSGNVHIHSLEIMQNTKNAHWNKFLLLLGSRLPKCILSSMCSRKTSQSIIVYLLPL